MQFGSKVLIVDDEEKIIEVLRSYFENSGYKVYEACNGIKALELFAKIKPDLVMLDLMLPDMTGEDVCRSIRKQSRVPIIMLTAKVEEEDMLRGLDIGADDYITKPFSPKQVLARAAAVLRRSASDAVPLSNTLSFFDDDLIIDNNKHEVIKNREVVNLTPNEYKLLMALIKYPQKAFTREELVLIAFGDDYEGYDRTIDTHIKNLRQKIENDPKDPQYVVTVYGVGYRFGGR